MRSTGIALLVGLGDRFSDRIDSNLTPAATKTSRKASTILKAIELVGGWWVARKGRGIGPLSSADAELIFYTSIPNGIEVADDLIEEFTAKAVVPPGGSTGTGTLVLRRTGVGAGTQLGNELQPNLF